MHNYNYYYTFYGQFDALNWNTKPCIHVSVITSTFIVQSVIFAALQKVPLVVEICTSIVECQGLENQGIYRIPGNTGAVNTLQELFNKAQVAKCRQFICI